MKPLYLRANMLDARKNLS